MRSYQKTQQRIALCKSCEANGLAENLKKEYRGLRRELETRLDEAKSTARESYLEKIWN